MPYGKVLDANTGAHVLVRYIGDGVYAWPDPGATARDYCYGTLVMLTNEQGECEIECISL